MAKVYRPARARLAGLMIVGLIIAFLWAVARPAPIKVFAFVAGVFAVLTIAAWSYIGIYFERDYIVRIVFFVFRSRRPLSSIRNVRFDTDVDSFGGRTSYVTIAFYNKAKPFLLFDFSKDDLEEIVERISAAVPNVIDHSISEHLKQKQTLRRAFRPEDRVLFLGAAAFLLLLFVWIVLQRTLLA